MKPRIASVVENHLCTGCGTCVGVCPTNVLKMAETHGGLVHPGLGSIDCRDCGRCGEVCPQMAVSGAMREYLSDPFPGPVQQAFLGEAADPAAAAAGQTGGMGRALLAWVLETGLARSAVCVLPNPDNPLRPIAALTASPAEVLTSTRSQYCPIPVNTLIRTIRNGDGPVAYLGLGCHLQGLTLAMERDATLREKVSLKIGLFCDRVLSYRAADFLVRSAGLRPGEIASFDYRDKTWHGWPGDIRVEDRQGRVRHLSRAYRTGSREFFTPLPCRLCLDKFNALADISLGDPYGLSRGPQVPTAVIARTARGLSCLREAQRAGKITLRDADSEKIFEHQHASRRVQDALRCGRRMVKKKLNLPSVLHLFDLKDSTRTAGPLWIRWAVWSGIYFQTPSGIKTLRYLPKWLPRLVNFLERWTRRSRSLGKYIRRGK